MLLLLARHGALRSQFGLKPRKFLEPQQCVLPRHKWSSERALRSRRHQANLSSIVDTPSASSNNHQKFRTSTYPEGQETKHGLAREPNKEQVDELVDVDEILDQDQPENCPPTIKTNGRALDNNPFGRKSTPQEREAVCDALLRDEPLTVLRAFMVASKDPEYLRSLPATTVAEILRTIDPKHFIDPYKVIYRDLHPKQISHLRDGTRQLRELFLDYSKSIEVLLTRWRQIGGRLGLSEYRILLNVARVVGDGKTAKFILNALRLDGLEPDSICYNHYFEARCWDNAYDPVESRKLRVIPYHLAMRRSAKRDNYRKPGFRGYQVGERGLKQEVVKVFEFMVSRGVMADVKTFSMLMQAMGREGDMEGVKSILNRVWDVNVDAILAEDDSDLLFKNDLPPDSPTYPDKDLLFTIAHIFGANNELSSALRVIDYFSRKYSIEIDIDTWSQLLEWTFVLATPRYGPRKTDGAQLGQLPLASVENVFNTMVSEPYNQQPTMPMLDIRIRTLRKRQMLNPMLDVMRAGQALHRKNVTRYHGPDQIKSNAEEEAPPEDLEKASKQILISAREEQKSELSRLYNYRDFLMISRWTRLLVAGYNWGEDRDHCLWWQRIGVPNAVEEFWDYRPRPGFGYNIAAARLQFHPTTVTMTLRMGSSSLQGVSIIRDAEKYRGDAYAVKTRYQRLVTRAVGHESTAKPTWYQYPVN